MKWDSSWWPRPPSRWFIVCIAVLINLVVLALLYRIGVYVDGCCESAWFERFWNGAFATMTGTLTLGGFLIKHAFVRPGQPQETAGLPDPRQLADDYLADQHEVAQQVRIGNLFDTHCELPGGRTQVRLASIYVPLDAAEESPERVNEPGFKRLSFARVAEGAIPVTQALDEGIAKAPDGLRLVLVGEPGSGKSSVVGELIHQCRPGASPPDDWPAALRRRLVLRFDLKLLGAEAAAGDEGATAPYLARAARGPVPTPALGDARGVPRPRPAGGPQGRGTALRGPAPTRPAAAGRTR